MQDPNADTQWNDELRKHGILPKKECEVTEDDVVRMLEATVLEKTKSGKSKDEMTLDELKELEDEEDERVFEEYRAKRIAELKLLSEANKFGEVREITGIDYTQEVNDAGEGIFVVLHLYKPGIPLCTLINNYLTILAAKFKSTKFLKSLSDSCIPNFPDSNLPTIFIYFEGAMKDKFLGPAALRGMNISIDELEWMLSKSGAVKSDIKEDPRPKIDDVLFSQLQRKREDDSDED
ncbi:unnamed protein product [Notodromas monacha]|uniref:Phosducin domain-containing protein n=1 Tax=Notodromas monacha TaxID=399045 RepID=A0A7R9BFR2_9CRUS|nr:unnamed protein product [Notodromas monacha]CAG0914608.1 unnamed protein product [Notodromas monacha]